MDRGKIRPIASKIDEISDPNDQNILEKANLYIKSFPKYCPLQVFNNRFYGIWIMGNYYGHNSKYYGEFPNSLKKRILSLFPDCKDVLHLFSGKIEDHNVLTYDINSELKPSICDDVRNIGKYASIVSKTDLVIADPPYDKSDFTKYGIRPFNKSWVIRELGKIMKPGSFLVWLDTRVPMYSRKIWQLLGYIGIIVSTNHRIRCLSFYQKH